MKFNVVYYSRAHCSKVQCSRIVHSKEIGIEGNRAEETLTVAVANNQINFKSRF
jgi:hypothetical protein